ncbi:MAG: transporter substrate-binding domain-containing protein, partial [Clostridia bacterium]|nr:transporter substrate-binding domain-containing protein [Clostridia bacterium]
MKRFTAAMLALVMLLAGLALAEESDRTVYTAVGDLNGARIGVQTGTNFDAMVRESLPDARIEYYNTKADLVAALTGDKIDAFAVDEPVAQILLRESDQVAYLPEYLDRYEFAAVFPKGEAGETLRDVFNAFLRQLPEGTLDALAAKWFGEDEDVKTMPDTAALSAENGTLRLATESGYVPFEYVRDGAVVGYDMELAAMFCAYGGYGLEIVDMNFDGILPAVQAGKCELAVAGISVMPERAQSVLFSEPYFSGGTVLVVPKSNAGEAAQQASGVRWQDYNGKRLGVLVGPVMENAARTYFPDSEHLLFNGYPDCITALVTGRIDGYLGDEPGVKSVHAEQPEIDYIHDRITQNNYSFAFRKDDPESAALCAQLNDFLARSWADGTMQELDDIWFGNEEERKVVDMSGLTGENGVIKVVTTSTDMPFSYIKDGKNVGYDIDLVVRFCRDSGYALELGDVDFAGRIPAIQSGKYDFTTDMNVTPEREEQVLFSDPTSYGGIVLAVRSADLAAAEAEKREGEAQAAGESFLDSVASSFNRTFIREERWRLFTDGVATTLLITLLTILFGTLLGFGVFM